MLNFCNPPCSATFRASKPNFWLRPTQVPYPEISSFFIRVLCFGSRGNLTQNQRVLQPTEPLLPADEKWHRRHSVSDAVVSPADVILCML